MDENQVFEQAKQMFLTNKGRKEVIEFMEANGIPSDKANTMATEAYQAIREKRMEAVKAIEQEETGGEGGGMKSIVIGALIFGAGLIATMATDRIWYGAMAVGAISVLTGIAKSFR